ncbi:hypothetical protein [Lysobacter sp. CA199]|uniref:hypothetical protein n=1 Tax=Lysobacter sp. CA199 TaxID=3455608 RepID=UPI003F8D3E0D
MKQWWLIGLLGLAGSVSAQEILCPTTGRPMSMEPGCFANNNNTNTAPAPPAQPDSYWTWPVGGFSLGLNNAVAASKALDDDPKFKAYKAGFWTFPEPRPGARAGEYCIAYFSSLDGAAGISGPGGELKGGLLTFWHPDIPKPPKARTVQVTLEQADGSSHTVKAMNYTMPNVDIGSISVYVPSAQNVIDGIDDKATFRISLDGKKVVDLTWHSGLEAKRHMQSCVAQGVAARP